MAFLCNITWAVNDMVTVNVDGAYCEITRITCIDKNMLHAQLDIRKKKTDPQPFTSRMHTFQVDFDSKPVFILAYELIKKLREYRGAINEPQEVNSVVDMTTIPNEVKNGSSSNESNTIKAN